MDEMKRLVANACRILAVRGLVDDILGHVSVRLDESTILIRSRGRAEQGLRFTTVDDIQVVRPDGSHDMADGFSPPNELPLHLGVYANDPAANAVVHAHPPAVVATSLVTPTLRPIIGAFNIPSMRMALHGIPVYESAALVRTAERGREVAAIKGSAPACVLRGHGLVTSGNSVEEAVINAINLDRLAEMTLRVLSAGGELGDIDPSDLVDLPDLGGSFNTAHVWRFHLRELEAVGLLVRCE